MNLKQLVNNGLRRLTRRNENIAKKPRYPPVGKTHVVCGDCGGEIIEVNKNTHRRACFRCGKEAQ
jgi:hypothetical protein